MNTPQLDLVEEQGKISFIEYTPTGIFILKIEKRKYRGTQIQSQVFQLNDEVHVIFHQRTQHLYAVLNKSKQILYLNEDIIALDRVNYVDDAKSAFHFTLCMTLFLLVAYLIFQYAMDGTIYYLDTLMHIALLACILFVGSFIYTIIHSKKENKLPIATELLALLNLPKLSGRMLQSFKLMNGYFFEFEHLFDLREIYKLKVDMNDQKVEHYLAGQMLRVNNCGLNVFEIEKCQLELIKGDLQHFKIEEKTDLGYDDDALREILFKVKNQKFYSLFDEFPFTKGRQIQVVATKFPDLNGRYAWLVYDQILFLSMDPDVLQSKTLQQLKIGNLEEFGDINGIFVIACILAMIFFGLFYAVFLAGVFGILYFHGKFCYSTYLKMSKKRNINTFVQQQISELMPSINFNKLNKEFVIYFNQTRLKNSRTGFKKEYKVLD
ncbi:hypothetical protein BEN71_09440 [Acinetobacter wuhouensis]|uniref:hypothetical protein n=1 Tax=Acinetobacter wuhouensis TaxID=1879050 RepID=UPI00083B0FA9|nr:hypothetical protein [Acinetobacter wuhouensis]AXQ22283.1 hypothetical protein BEN71_09440 [Acinetobacter wuhouensis]